jgi:predicted transposase YbfD/YdcC
LITVERKRFSIKTGRRSIQTAYWISNQTADNKGFTELTEAIRKHWSIEVHHYCRDVQWGEDRMIMRDKAEANAVASFITVATNLFQKQDSNTSELREKIMKNWKMIHTIFKPK